MGSIQREGGKWAVLPWIFVHDTVNVFFNKHLLCENIPALTKHFSSLLYAG